MNLTDRTESGAPAEEEDVAALRPDVPRRRARLGPAGIVVVVILLGVWAAAATISAGRAALDLRDARAALISAEQQLRQADLSGAREHLDAGVASATSASAQLHRPYVVPLRVLPVVGPNLRTATALSDAAGEAGGAASRLLETASTIVHDERESEHGEISLDYLADLHVPLHDLADALEQSTAQVQASPTRSLLGPLADARASYLELAVPATEKAAVGAALIDVVPGFLGADGPRRYLVAAGTLSELRASGGLMGSWSTLTADAGRLSFDPFLGVDELSSLAEDARPPSAEFATRYARLGSLRQWRNANLTPDFPSSAQVMLELWDAQGHEPLDGVIMADPVVFQRIAERVGPLEVPDVGVFGPAELLRFVALDAYDTFEDDDERKEILGAVATLAFAQLFDVIEDDDVPATVEMLADLTRGGHLRIHSRDVATEAALLRAGVTGGLPDSAGEFGGVFVNNVAANKVDFFTTRRLEHRVQLLPFGATRAVISAEFENTAPRDGYSRGVLGPWTDRTEAGDNLSLISVVCGYACEVDELPDGFVDGGTELGRPVFDVQSLVPAGGRRVLQVQTETADGWQEVDDRIVVPITHVVQPTLRPSPLRVSLRLPPGWVAGELPEGAVDTGDELVWEGEASGPVELTFELVRAP